MTEDLTVLQIPVTPEVNRDDVVEFELFDCPAMLASTVGTFEENPAHTARKLLIKTARADGIKGCPLIKPVAPQSAEPGRRMALKNAKVPFALKAITPDMTGGALTSIAAILGSLKPSSGSILYAEGGSTLQARFSPDRAMLRAPCAKQAAIRVAIPVGLKRLLACGANLLHTLSVSYIWANARQNPS